MSTDLSPATISPRTTNPARPASIQRVANAIRTLWPDMVGGQVPQQALEIALAQAGHEGRWGAGWTGDMAGSNNMGGYQCGNASGGVYFKCVEHTDSRPNSDGTQTPYKVTFRYYIDGTTPDGKSRNAKEAAVWDFLNSITSPKRFDLSEPLRSGDILEYARQGYNHHYFESFNLTQAGTDAWAGSIGELLRRGVYLFHSGKKVATSQPDGSWFVEPGQTIPVGSPSAVMVAGRVALYAHTLADYMPDILAALGVSAPTAFVPEELLTFKPNFVAQGLVNPTWHAPSGAPASTSQTPLLSPSFSTGPLRPSAPAPLVARSILGPALLVSAGAGLFIYGAVKVFGRQRPRY